ncbi:MAG: hypothetical protein D6743_01840 [Calditrichaeota bacterium]|nr:MAG: hypothetical protein D6743_01840 [Calditrichota bacterium]
MEKKWLVPVVLVAAGVLVIGIALIQELNLRPQAQLPEGWTFTLPQGDATAGRNTFIKMECGACHKSTLPGVREPEDGKWAGPDLTVGYNTLPDAYLAESIIRAHTKVADPTYHRNPDQAGMGKYNRYLTVKELIDLVAFLKQPTQVAQK